MGLDPNLLCHGDDDSVSDYFDGSFQTDRMIKGHGILWLCPIVALIRTGVHKMVTHLTDEKNASESVPSARIFLRHSAQLLLSSPGSQSI